MHVHHCGMRTTIELDDRIRQALIRRAAERGDKGYSKIINEAVAAYLEIDQAELARRSEGIRNMKGAISNETARWLHESVREVREQWQTGS